MLQWKSQANYKSYTTVLLQFTYNHLEPDEKVMQIDQRGAKKGCKCTVDNILGAVHTKIDLSWIDSFWESVHTHLDRSWIDLSSHLSVHILDLDRSQIDLTH